MYNIKLLNKIAACGTSMFSDDKYNVGENVENPDAIMVRSAAMHDMEFGNELLAIARAGAGVNNIPIDRCSEKGIVVFNTPGANANAVKELAVAALLLASRKIVDGIAWAQSLAGSEDVAKAVEKGKSAFVGPELAGKSLGIIGLGAIGAQLANVATHLGMKVYGYDPYITVDAAWTLSKSVNRAKTLAAIYENCDYISVHVPSTPETKGMINETSISCMKDGVRIINLARADLVNAEAVKKALADGKVASYVTDFPNEEVIGVPGIITIPHLGASTPESEDNCAAMACSELKDYLENGNIVNSVNYPNCIMPRGSAVRVCVLHKNVPNMISQITAAVADAGINIANMMNKNKGDFAYTMLDIDAANETLKQAIETIDGVVRVRVLN